MIPSQYLAAYNLKISFLWNFPGNPSGINNPRTLDRFELIYHSSDFPLRTSCFFLKASNSLPVHSIHSLKQRTVGRANTTFIRHIVSEFNPFSLFTYQKFKTMHCSRFFFSKKSHLMFTSLNFCQI